jgi:hypothetical protein
MIHRTCRIQICQVSEKNLIGRNEQCGSGTRSFELLVSKLGVQNYILRSTIFKISVFFDNFWLCVLKRRNQGAKPAPDPGQT